MTETTDGYMVSHGIKASGRRSTKFLHFRWRASDFGVANHFVARYSNSHSGRDFTGTRTEQDTRKHSDRQTDSRSRGLDGWRDERRLDAERMAEVLTAVFGLPVKDDWRPLLERVAAGTA